MLRKALLTTFAAAWAGAAVAADAPYDAAPAYAPTPIFSWTGFYLGGQIGYAWATNTLASYGPYYSYSGVNYSPNGVVGGAHVGYNYQMNQFVLGLEGDVEGSGVSQNYGFGPTLHRASIPVQGTIRGRFGFALDRALLYVTGGAAFAGVDTSYQSWMGYDSLSRSSAGWTIGGGLEYAFTPEWSARAEYRYTDLGSFTDYVSAPGPGSSVTNHLTSHTVRLGFSYHFASPIFGR